MDFYVLSTAHDHVRTIKKKEALLKKKKEQRDLDIRSDKEPSERVPGSTSNVLGVFIKLDPNLLTSLNVDRGQGSALLNGSAVRLPRVAACH